MCRQISRDLPIRTLCQEECAVAETVDYIVSRNPADFKQSRVKVVEPDEFMKLLCKWMDLEGIFLSEVTHSQRNSHNMYSLISGY